MSSQYGIIDLFAGPGGLGEGFASWRDGTGSRPFHIHLSAEKEASAHATLQLRSFLRQFDDELPGEYIEFHAGQRPEPDWEELYPKQWETAVEETRQLELGTPEGTAELDSYLRAAKKKWKTNTVVIGGPPCQAYSLVGRARNKGIAGYSAADDHRHFLFREYIHVLETLRPAVFVMENVKGMLSAKVDGKSIFEMLSKDLSGIGGKKGRYLLVPLSGAGGEDLPDREPGPADFILRAERHGVPQARHRVILMGVRNDVAQGRSVAELRNLVALRDMPRATASNVLDGMPVLRSGLSKTQDGAEEWRGLILEVMKQVISVDGGAGLPKGFAKQARKHLSQIRRQNSIPPRNSSELASCGDGCPEELRDWIGNERLAGTANHETRGHMRTDLERYFFASVFAELEGRSPKAAEFPEVLAPDHRNWDSGKFADRFRVQVGELPSSTITSHISKDGHYFIHPDPAQCRSLTVREAARLQTFPDDYLFLGNRTQQYTQVGNAVPPYLAKQIAGAVHRLLDI